MKTSISSLALSFILLCCLADEALAQKQRNTSPARAQAVRAEDETPTPTFNNGDSIQTTICKGQPTPTGYVTAGETSTSDCPSGAWILKRRGTRLRADAPPVTGMPPKDTAANDDEDEEPRARRRATASEADRLNARAEQENLEAERSLEKLRRKRERDEAARLGRVMVGMTKEQAIRAWGTPTKVNASFSSDGKNEQWVYYRRGYIYFNAKGHLDYIQSW